MMETTLKDLIIERIEHNGPLSFAEYMRMALYEPLYGYYVTGEPRMGWSGDYFTSTDVSTLFAHCMGRQLKQLWQKLGRPAPFVVLEQGAGRGDLAREVCTWAAQEESNFSQALDYQTADIRAGIDVISSSSSSKPSVILSNELVDAFPVHIVEKREDRLYEVFVGTQYGQLYEFLDEPGTAEVAKYLDHYHIPWQTFRDGWRAEINLEAVRWMQQSASLLRKGYLLTIDYGDKARMLYTPARHRGTLACYFQHQFSERALGRPGEQDITAHVNFSALITEGRRHGLRLQTFTTQRLWLENMGIREELEQRRTGEFALADTQRASNEGQIALLHWYNLRQQVFTLTDMAGMGNFKVLIMHR